MKIRLIIYFILTVAAAMVFAFVPGFNLVGIREVSAYQQYLHDGSLIPFIKNVFGLSIVVFIGLLFLFGLTPKEKRKPAEK